MLRPGEDTIELGSHCVSAILRAAGLPDLKGLFAKRGGGSGDNSNNNSRAMSAANLSMHQASLSSRGGSGNITPSEKTSGPGSSTKIDDNCVEIRPPANPFLSKSMKGSFSKSLSALGAVKEDMKMKKVMEMANANMALGISGKAPSLSRTPSAKVFTQSSKEPNNPDDITPTATLQTSDDGVKESQSTPLTPSKPAVVKADVKTDAKSPNPALTKSMRGSFSKSLTMLNSVKEADNPYGVVNEVTMSTRSHSAPPAESTKEPSKPDDNSLKMLNMSSRMGSLSVLKQSSKEPSQMLKSKWKLA